MAGRLEYKRPRKINVVSVSLTLVALALIYLGYQFAPMVLTKQEAYRALEEASSAFAHTPGKYTKTKEAMQSLKNKMDAQLRLSGVSDPAMESWIETEDEQTYQFGVLYSAYFEWPFDVMERKEFVYEISHEIKLK